MVVKSAERQVTIARRLIAFVLAVLFGTVTATVWLVFDNAWHARDEVIELYERVRTANELFSAVQDAETGQRGFLLTEDKEYLKPYEAAIGRIPPLLESLIHTDSPQSSALQQNLEQLPSLVDSKLSELAETIALTKAGRRDEALAVVVSDQGKRLMDSIRNVVDTFGQASRAMLAERSAALKRAADSRLIFTILVIVVLFAALIAGFALLRKAFRSLREAERKAEADTEQLQVSLDSLSQGISVFDADGRLARWNACFVELFSVPERLLRIGTPYASFVRHDWTDDEGDFLETPEQLAAAPPQTIGRATPIVYERARKDGRAFELRRTPLPSGGFVVTYADITHRLATEAQLRKSQRMDAIGQLTGGIAHDFNNLLTVILGNLGSLRRANAPSVNRHLEMAFAAAERGASLTRQLLAFARRQPLEPRPLDVNRLLSELGSFIQRSLGERVSVETVTGAGLWTVLADPWQLENAILNLTLNARDAMPDGGRIIIEAANAVLDSAYAQANAEVRPGDYVMIAVTDTGSGMPPDVLVQAFEPFFTTKGEGRGSGLGLSQVFGFVKQSSGHVKIYSEVGTGTSVKLYLPRTTQPAIQVVRPPEEMVRGYETVLVVEDDTDVRRTAIGLLRELGYRCVEAPNAQRALELLADPNIAVDLLFTDVVLPGGMLGRQLAEQAQASDPKLRVLYTSGYTRNAIIHNGRVDENVIFLGKPYKKAELAAKLREALGPVGAPPSVTAVPDTPSSPPRPSLVILLVEDDLLVRWLALDLLKGLGHVPLEARTAGEALALLDAAERIDAMIADLGLPDMRGQDLVLKARSRRPDLPIVVASGYGDEPLDALADLPRLVFVAKPYGAHALQAALDDLSVRPTETV